MIRLQEGYLPINKADNICIFSHYDNENQVADYVYYYLKELQKNLCDIIFVSTCDILDTTTIIKLRQYCAIVIVRDNIGYDFGSYKCGIESVGELRAYKRLIIANDSVYGPLYDLKDLIEYGDKNLIDIWGATDSYEINYHIQSYFIVYSHSVINSKTFKDFWDHVVYLSNEIPNFKMQIVENYEIGGSNHFITHGFKLGALCNIKEVTLDIEAKLSILDEKERNRYAYLTENLKNPLNQTHFFWDFLIKYHKYPFIKKELLALNPININLENWDLMIQNISKYDLKLITNHLNEIQRDKKIDRFQWFFDNTKTKTGVVLPYFLTQLLTVWPDLNDTKGVNNESENGVLCTLAWWENPGRLLAKDIQWPANNIFPSIVYEQAEEIIQDQVLMITKGMIAAYKTREDLQHFSLDTEIGRNQFVLWRLSSGKKEYRYLSLSEEEKDILQSPVTLFNGVISHLPKLSLLLPSLYVNDSKTVRQLMSCNVETFNQCWDKSKDVLLSLIDDESPISNLMQATFFREKPFGTYSNCGVNTIGFPRAFFGIAEDVRTTTQALLLAGVPTAVCSAPIPLATKCSTNGWIETMIRQEATYNVNIINMPAADTFQLLLRGWSGLFVNRYNIGAWQWELPNWPKKWVPLLNMIDEIWAQSRFVEKMFKAITKKPVHYMPLSVEEPIFDILPRSEFNINNDEFVYMSVFDGNSWIARKNPLAAVKAFTRSFPKEKTDVTLVVKVMNSRPGLKEYDELLRFVENDSRIRLIDATLSRNDMLALLNCCDVFVSLHRSEGFGRVIAECMLMGKPVISTNFSGSLDFAHEGTAFIVDGPLIEVQSGDYVEFEGQYWMDPDIDIAVEHFKTCYEQPGLTGLIAKKGQLYVQEYHSIKASAIRFADRLNELNLINHNCWGSSIVKQYNGLDDA